MFRNVYLVARREYLQAVRSKAFLIATVMIPVFMIGVTVLPSLFIESKNHDVNHIVLATSDPGLGAALQQEIHADEDLKTKDGADSVQITVSSDLSDSGKAALRDKVLRHEIGGFIWATDAALAHHNLTYSTASASNFIEAQSIQHALRNAWMKQQMARRGVSPADSEALLKPLKMESVELSKRGESRSGSAMFLVTYGLAMMLFVPLIQNGVSVMRSIVEEKQSRVLEVMLATVTPTELLAGKIIGVVGAGLTQTLIWVVVAAVKAVPMLAAISNGIHLPASALIFFPVFFVTGFLFYSTIFAAIGSVVSSEQEGQQFQLLATLPLIFSITLMLKAITRPNDPLIVGASFFPFSSPLLMYVRIVVQQPPAWQIALALAIQVAATIAMMWLCARIYRVGILMYGKRPNLPEILKWIRYA